MNRTAGKIAAAALAAAVLLGLAASPAPTRSASTGEAPAAAAPKPQRFGSVIGLRAEKLEKYKKLHAACWPSVLKQIHGSNIRNFSIYLRKLPDGNYYLFSYFEYIGSDFKADMAKMAADPETKRWWAATDPCQRPLPDRPEGQWWAPMEEIFHQD